MAIKNDAELARDRARNLLDLNNSLGSNTADRIFSILEGGEGNLYLKDQVDHALNKLITNHGIASQWNSLTKYLSVKDKIAYTSGILYSNNTPGPNTVATALDEKLVKEKLNETIKYLQDNLMQNQQFTESWILRNAAYNRFECKMNAQERENLNSIANEIKEVCKKNNLETLVSANDFTNESDAQKIVKLTENIGQISARGIAIEEQLLKKVASMEEKIKPLKDLDKRYKHLIGMMNMASEIAKRKYKSMIPISSQEKLNTILTERGKKPEEFIITGESKDTNQLQLLEEKLSLLKGDGKYDELIQKHHLTKNQFDEWFLVYFTYKNVENAKIKLEAQKVTTFGHRLKDYELDTNKRKGSIRERIFEIAANLEEGPDGQRQFRNTPEGNQDYETICSYFNKFQNIFFANERDAYTNEQGESHFLAIRNTLSAMFRRRVPAICNGGHERYGSLPRKMLKWLEWFFQGKEEKGIFKMVKKRWYKSDHADILSMIVMIQNQTDQEMFHGKNPFGKKDKRYSKIFRGLGLAEQGRSKVAETISPYTNKLMKIVEVATKAVAKPIVYGAQAYNNALKNYKRYKTPLYLLYPATRIAAQGGKAYNGVKKYLSEIQGKQVNYLYESIADTVDGVTRFGAETIAGGGKAMYRKFETNQQRSVLDKVFELAAEDEKRKEVLQSSDLANMFDAKNRETYLFDEDGRTQMVDQTEKTEKDITKDTLEKKHEEIQQQFNVFLEDMRKRYEVFDTKMDDYTPGTPEYETALNQLKSLANTMDTWNDEKSEINDILLVIQQVAIGAITGNGVFNNEISTRVAAIGTKLTDGEKLIDNEDIANLGYKQQIKDKEKQINEQKVTLKKVEDKIGTSTHEGDLSSTELRDERTTVQTEINIHKTETRSKQTELLEKQGEVSSLKSKNNQIDDSIAQAKRKQKGLEDEKAKWVSLNTDLTTKNAEMIDPATPVASKGQIQKDINELKRKLSKISETSFNGSSDSPEIDEFMDKLGKNITDDEDAFNENKTKITVLDGEITILNGEIEDIKEDINRKKSRIEEIDKKLSAKGPADKSWVECQADKATIEQAINILEKDKGDLTKKMGKQEEKNRVYRKLHRRGKKVENLAKTLADIDGNTGVNDKEKEKLRIKTIKDCDLDFGVKKEITTDGLSEKQKKEIADILSKKNTPAETTA